MYTTVAFLAVWMGFLWFCERLLVAGWPKTAITLVVLLLISTRIGKSD